MPYVTSDFCDSSQPAVTLMPSLSMDENGHRNTMMIMNLVGLGSVAGAAIAQKPAISICIAMAVGVNFLLQKLLDSNRKQLLNQSQEFFLRGNYLVIVEHAPHLRRTTRSKLDAHWARAQVVHQNTGIDSEGTAVIRIQSRGKTLHVGHFLPPSELEDAARMINQALDQNRQPSWVAE